MLTFAEVCQRLRITPKTLRKLINAGEIAAVRVGGNGAYRISHQALADYLERNTVVIPS